MKIRLISDLHIDINEKYPLDLHIDEANDVFTLVAGDVSGYPKLTIEWIRKNLYQGAFICGNHDAYDSSMPIEDIKALYHKEFPVNANITFFDNDVGVISKEIDENVLLVADVMYIDYKLPIKWTNPRGDQRRNMMLADPAMNRNGGMNDFNYGRCNKVFEGINDYKKKKEGTWRLVPQYYLEHHEKAFSEVTKIVESNPNKHIILMTHMGLSPQCLDSNYESGEMSASYASDKEDWIKSHPNIKCIFSGHVHCRKKFMVGSTLYVMNALGYCNRHLKQFSKETNQYECWTPDCFLDTKTWEVEWKPKDNPVWIAQKNKDDEAFKKFAPFFF